MDQPVGTTFSNYYWMEYRPVEYESPAYFQLSIMHMQTSTILLQLNMLKDIKHLISLNYDKYVKG